MTVGTTDLIFIFGLPSVLGVLALCTIVAAQLRKRKLVRALKDSEGFLRAMREDGEASSPLVQATREHLLRSETPDGQRFVLAKSLAAVRREYAEDEVSHHWAFWFGGLLTGLALLATFVLIAYVMTNDISGAIRDTAGEDDTAMGHLSEAVRTLGGKFYISAAGIGGSVLALFSSNSARNAILSCAEHPEPRLLSAFTTVEAMLLNAKLHELELARADREARAAQHVELCSKLDMLNTRVEKLNSIDVSVRDIGNEVSANLKNVMKEAMADQFKEILVQTMAEVSAIAERVQGSLTQTFGQQIQKLAQGMQEGLDALKRAVEGQGQGQLEQILDKLQSTVSGGFQSETKNMAVALDGFAKAIPALEQQLRTMTSDIAAESRQRSTETARTTQMLLDQVASLVDAISAQQTANMQAVAQMQAAAAQGAEDMARRLEASGANLVSSVLGSSRAEIEAIVGQMRAMAEWNASHQGDIEARAANASNIVAWASDALAKSAQSISEISNQTQGVLTQVRQSSEEMQSVAQGFLNAGNTLVVSVESMRKVVESTRAQTQEQQALLVKQQQYTKEVEQLWPKLFDTYLGKFRESADELARSWADFHSKIETASKCVGAEFAENTLVLSEAVTKLVEINGGRHAKQ